MNATSKSSRTLLRYSQDHRTLFLLGALSSLYLAHWLAGANAHWLIVPSALLAITACVVKHNHIHSPTFRSPRLNRCFNFWLALLTGTSSTGIRIAHNQRHHRANQSPEDFVRCSQVAQLPAPLALLCFFPLVAIETWSHTRKDIALLRTKSAPLHRMQRMEKAAVCLLIAMTVLLDWQMFLWVFGIPWLVGQWFIVTINLVQHDGLDSSNEMLDSRNVISRFGNWLLLNNGYHTAHHMRSALHWSLLPEFHRQNVATFLPPALESTSLVGMIFDWWKTRSNPAATIERRAVELKS
jgi:beta-carotene hydroxylase